MPITRRPSWTDSLLQDLLPAPGRLSSTLRIVLASAIALILMETLRMPFISIGMYFIFLIGRDSPAVSLRSALTSVSVVILVILVELAVVILSDNDPIARLLSVAVVTFVAGMAVVCTSQPALGSSFGLIYCTVINLWEGHAPAGTLVSGSLQLLGTFLIALGTTVAVEYCIATRDPAARLQAELAVRYAALTKLFRLYADDAPPPVRLDAAAAVSRMAASGQDGMLSLYNDIVERDLDPGLLPIAVRPRVVMLAQLMEVSAAFGLQNPPQVDGDTRERCAHVAQLCAMLTSSESNASYVAASQKATGKHVLLDRVASALHAILSLPEDGGLIRNRALVALPRKKVPFLIPGAVRNVENVAFALKISLCATLCYILYHALAWPGIATAVTTVMVTGLSSTAAIKQRLIFRLLGSVIGGLVLGIGATVFLFPHMDSITSLVLLEAAIAFIGAWIAAGSRFNYIGLQIAFSFYAVAYEGFSSPTELAPARDRFVGILIALLLMLFVFDQLWPVRTTTIMRRKLSSLLRLGASLLTTLNLKGEGSIELVVTRRQVDILRARIGTTVAELRSANGSVPFELGSDLEAHVHTGDQIVRAGITATALFWNQIVILYNEQDLDFLTDPKLKQMRTSAAVQLNSLADQISGIETLTFRSSSSTVSSGVASEPRYAEYLQNTADRLEDLMVFAKAIGGWPDKGVHSPPSQATPKQ